MLEESNLPSVSFKPGNDVDVSKVCGMLRGRISGHGLHGLAGGLPRPQGQGLRLAEDSGRQGFAVSICNPISIQNPLVFFSSQKDRKNYAQSARRSFGFTDDAFLKISMDDLRYLFYARQVPLELRQQLLKERDFLRYR